MHDAAAEQPIRCSADHSCHKIVRTAVRTKAQQKPVNSGLPHVRADVTALGATLDVIPDQAHLGTFFTAAETVLAAVSSRLR
jgi:hypothetical protein